LCNQKSLWTSDLYVYTSTVVVTTVAARVTSLILIISVNVSWEM
jgi:hypothetical protein